MHKAPLALHVACGWWEVMMVGGDRKYTLRERMVNLKYVFVFECGGRENHTSNVINIHIYI